MRIIINRVKATKFQTTGDLIIYGPENEILFKCYTLELPDLNNQRRVSRIPSGVYEVVKRTSPKYKKHFHVLNVPERDNILIHHGNYNRDTLGCILVGREIKDIDGDGNKDVTSSKSTMKKLNSILPEKCTVTIFDEC